MRTVSLPNLKKKADTVTSKYIRLKHSKDGNVTCVSCGKVMPWKEAHCAHFVERGKTPTRWLEENLWPACPSCNVYRKEFHMRNYTLHMVDFYGLDFVTELERMSRKVMSPSEVRTLAEQAITEYSEKLKELE